MSNTYRLQQPLRAVRLGEQASGEIVGLPAGALLNFQGPTGIPGFVVVSWEGRPYSVFEEDLLDRAIKVLDAAV